MWRGLFTVREREAQSEDVGASGFRKRVPIVDWTESVFGMLSRQQQPRRLHVPVGTRSRRAHSIFMGCAQSSFAGAHHLEPSVEFQSTAGRNHHGDSSEESNSWAHNDQTPSAPRCHYMCVYQNLVTTQEAASAPPPPSLGPARLSIAHSLVAVAAVSLKSTTGIELFEAQDAPAWAHTAESREAPAMTLFVDPAGSCGLAALTARHLMHHFASQRTNANPRPHLLSPTTAAGDVCVDTATIAEWLGTVAAAAPDDIIVFGHALSFAEAASPAPRR
jgi:hypothetical protein